MLIWVGYVLLFVSGGIVACGPLGRVVELGSHAGVA